MRIKRWVLLLGLLVLPLAVMADGLPDLGDASQADLTPVMERRIGESIMRDISLHEPSYMEDSEISGYLKRLGSRLVAQSSAAGQGFEFFVLRDSTINAFAMPGGFIGVHTGLILAAQSESELASVLAHEISHVTQRHLARQIGLQSQAQLPMLLSLAVAILAARSHSDVAAGAMMAGQAAGIQHQLSYSRDFEREADRVGLQLLERSGFDVRSMASFFLRLQKSSRLYDNKAPSYLLTHPLTTERIADIENRLQDLPYKQVPDALDYLMVRAKIQASEGTPADAVAEFSAQVRDHKFINEVSARYGLAYAQWRAKNYQAAEQEISELRRQKTDSAMLEGLAAELCMSRKDAAGALKILKPAIARYPQERSLAYAQVEALLAAGESQQALRATTDDLQIYPSDLRMHDLQAKTYATLGQRLQQHRALAEVYALRGQLLAAIEQLQLAQKAGDGDFYEHSTVDSKLRELKQRQAKEAKEAKENKQRP